MIKGRTSSLKESLVSRRKQDVSRAVVTNTEETQADAWAQQNIRSADIVRGHWQERGGQAQLRGDSPGLLWGMPRNSPGRGRGAGPSRLVDLDG